METERRMITYLNQVSKWESLLSRFLQLDKSGMFYDVKSTVFHVCLNDEKRESSNLPYIQRYVIGNLLSFIAMLHWIGGYGHDSLTTSMYADMAMIIWNKGLSAEEKSKGYLKTIDKKSKEYTYLNTLPRYLREMSAGNGIADGFRYNDAVKAIEYLERKHLSYQTLFDND